jgi:hypothetical protein
MNLMDSQTYKHLKKYPVTNNVETVLVDVTSWLPFGQFDPRGGGILVTAMMSVFENNLVARILRANENK